jgi:hypothetical protein
VDNRSTIFDFDCEEVRPESAAEGFEGGEV